MTQVSACIPNIGPRQRQRRMRGGLVLSAVTVAFAVFLLVGDVDRVWRVLIFAPALMAALGVFQAREQTCVALAAKGVRNMDAGDEPVTGAEQMRRISEQSRRVYGQSVAAALAVTILVLLA